MQNGGARARACIAKQEREDKAATPYSPSPYSQAQLSSGGSGADDGASGGW